MATATKSDLRAALESGELTTFFKRSCDSGALDEIDRDELRELYEQNPRSFELARIVGELSARDLAEHRRTAEQAAAPDRRTATVEARRVAQLDRELGDLDRRQFAALVADADGNCPGNPSDPRDPHPLDGYIRRAGSKWTCGLCDASGDVRPTWHERHAE